ncbi:MAG: hypothetical protein NVSMB43_02910 [Pseudarthrobacter sp.]
MSLRPLSASERADALQKAAAARAARAAVKERLKNGEMSAAHIISSAAEDDALARMRVAYPAAALDEADLAGGGYERVALAVMRALAGLSAGGPGASSGDRGTQLILNTPNTLPTSPAQATTAGEATPMAAIPGLPADAVVEVPCTVTPDGAVPLPQSAPGPEQLALLRRVKEVEQLTVRAATLGDRAAAVDAFSRHPLVDSAQLGAALLEGYERAFPALGALWRQE